MEEWLRVLVNEFWKKVAATQSFPRDLERVLPFGYRLTVERVPDLKVSHVEAWLHARGHLQSFGCRDRQISACLAAWGEAGAIFLCSEDGPDEQRFSIAHETGHFLTDFLAPRRRAVERLGPEIMAVLDGERPPTVDERLGAVLEGVPLGLYRNLMPRSNAGDIESGYVLRAEERADWVGLELLAPWDDVYTTLKRREALSGGRDGASAIIREAYGLPARIAAQYAARLVRPGRVSTRTWLMAT